MLKSTNEKKEIHDVTIDVPSSYLIEINDTTQQPSAQGESTVVSATNDTEDTEKRMWNRGGINEL